MIGFSFIYPDDGHEVKEDIHGLVLRAESWWGYLREPSPPEFQGHAAAGAITLNGQVIEELKLLAPKSSRLGLRDGTKGEEILSVKGPLSIVALGSRLALRDAGEALAIAGDNGWHLLDRNGETIAQLGDELVLIESQLVFREPQAPGPRVRLSALAERAYPA